MYEQLLAEATCLGLDVKEKNLHANAGKIKGNRIAIKKGLTNIEKACILSEEIGHSILTVGDITDQTIVENRKQEYKARAWAYERIISIPDIISAHEFGCKNIYEIADYLDVTESFAMETIEHYRKKHGVCVRFQNYIIYFEPNLGILKLI